MCRRACRHACVDMCMHVCVDMCVYSDMYVECMYRLVCMHVWTCVWTCMCRHCGMHVCVDVYADMWHVTTGTSRGQKRVSNPLLLEFQEVVSCPIQVLGTEPGFSAVPAFNPRAISSPTGEVFLVAPYLGSIPSHFRLLSCRRPGSRLIDSTSLR